MKSLLPLCVLIQGAASHYTFSHFLVNGTETPSWKYVRDVAGEKYGSYPPESWQFNKTVPYVPAWKLGQDNTLRCGRSSEMYALTTETATIIAGSEVGFRLLRPEEGAMNSFRAINHPGPAQAYLSKTENLAGDIGDGAWFKIGYAGPISDTAWAVNGQTDVNFTIPTATPPGTYLLRMEQFMPTRGNADGTSYSQWYVNCAHVDIISVGSGTPGPTIRIPEDYDGMHPGIHLPPDISEYGSEGGLDRYTPPGPAVWTG